MIPSCFICQSTPNQGPLVRSSTGRLLCVACDDRCRKSAAESFVQFAKELARVNSQFTLMSHEVKP